jgi:hypothetical protein
MVGLGLDFGDPMHDYLPLTRLISLVKVADLSSICVSIYLIDWYYHGYPPAPHLSDLSFRYNLSIQEELT